MSTPFLKWQYERHANHFKDSVSDSKRIDIAESWFDENSADFWRHRRAYEPALLLSENLHLSWLTVGDGRWGLDSIRIRDFGFTNVHPTDISESLLKLAQEKGLIGGYSIQNAEQLTFNSQSFDYAFCKESLHHFPRPYVALYELLRVSRKGVFIIEPNDSWNAFQSTAGTLIQLLQIARTHVRNSLRYLTQIQPQIHFSPPGWEVSGNYQFAVSRRELEKIALGLNLPQIVFKGLNDHYVEGCEFEPADSGKSSIFREIVNQIKSQDDQCKKGRRDFSLLMAGILTEPLDSKERLAFENAGWTVKDLPRNPYL